MTEASIWPNFFIVGAAKSGTTSLYTWLQQHPDVYMSPTKEPHFFSRDVIRTPLHVVRKTEEYLALFSEAAGYRAIGEASASYFASWKVVPERIKQTIPNARIIILLRDPVERAYSDYLMYFRRGQESRSFLDALKNSELRYIYIQTYTEAVQKYLQVFGTEKVLILMFQELKTNPIQLIRKVTRFLLLSEGNLESIDTSHENLGAVPRGKLATSLFALRWKYFYDIPPVLKPWLDFLRRFFVAPKPPLDSESVAFLRPIFEKDIDQLEQLLGQDFPELRKVW